MHDGDMTTTTTQPMTTTTTPARRGVQVNPVSPLPLSVSWPCAEHVKVGDTLMTGGGRLVVAKVEPYVHPQITGGERWAIVSDEHGYGVTLDRGLHSCCWEDQ